MQFLAWRWFAGSWAAMERDQSGRLCVRWMGRPVIIRLLQAIKNMKGEKNKVNFWSLGLTLPRRCQHLSDGHAGMQGFQCRMMSLPKKPVIHCASPPVSGAPSHPHLNYKEETQVCPLHFLWRRPSEGPAGAKRWRIKWRKGGYSLLRWWRLNNSWCCQGFSTSCDVHR